jgi:G5 domain/Lytic transglycolase
MSVTKRRRGLVVLSLLAGASLVRSSMALSVPKDLTDPTLNFRLAETEAGATAHHPDAWAYQGPPAATWTEAEGSLLRLPRQAPDGLKLVALVVKVGRQRPRPVLTNAVTGLELVGALGLKLSQTDVVKPSPDVLLTLGMRLSVIRIRRVVEKATEVVPFETLIQYSKDLDVGETQLVTAGRPGSAIRTYRVTYRNGREVGRVMLSELVLVQPVDQVMLTGNVNPAHGSQTGQASWYDFCRVDGDYAAHLTLPFGTVVTVTNLDNGKTVTVVINDRGPYGVPGRIIDLCDSAFAQIAPLSQGVADVEITW